VKTLLDDAFAHHVWATEVLIDVCAGLTPQQLDAPGPGTYGSVLDTLRHLVGTDCWYLTFFRDDPRQIAEDAQASLPELRAAITANGRVWAEILAGGPDPEQDVPEQDGGWEFHAPMALRLAQVVHHGTDHRSQVCTALTAFGITPPEIDLWVYGRAAGRTNAVKLARG
jgi:uncharacterized damage-inducible protein DinB